MRMGNDANGLVRAAALILAAFMFPVGTANADEDPMIEPFDGVAKPWILALKDGDTATLDSLTALPFVYATTAQGKECAGPVRTKAELGTWMSCLRKAQAPLFAKMDSGSYVTEKTGGWGEPKAFPTMAKNISRDGRWVQAYLLNPRGPEYSFRFLMAEHSTRPWRVAALMLAAQPEKEEQSTSRGPHNRALQRPGPVPRR